MRGLRTRTRGAGRRTLAGAIQVALALAVLPTAAPSPSDNQRVPDEPYRSLTATSTASAEPHPTSARADVMLADPVINIATGERRPQAYLLVQTASLRTLPGTTRILASLTPVALPQPGPRNGIPLGNAYDVDVRNQDGQNLEPSGAGARPVVQLRIPNPSIPGHVLLELHGQDRWTPLKTTRTADVIYAAELASFGTVVAVYTMSPVAPSMAAPGRVINPAWVVLSAGLIVLTAGAALVALGRGRRRTGSAQ